MKKLFLSLLGLLGALGLVLAQESVQEPAEPQLKQELLQAIDGLTKQTQVMVDMVFSLAEVGFQERETSAYLCGVLEKAGFRVERGVAGIPTAWVASWGEGKPVIGLISDIDALPGVSQKPGVAYQDALVPGGPGHGEGHNAGQAVNITAAIALQQVMRKHQLSGTIRLYPGVAEEVCGGKTHFVKAGLFKDVDIVLGAHISENLGTTWGTANSTIVSTEFTFRGQSAHAANSPWAGRSALDAVELMDIGWNFRREHLSLNQRSHYVITKGGDQPNVVPGNASVWYYFRETDYPKVKQLHELGQKMARAAAMMTDTEVTERVLGATWTTHFNKAIAEVLQRNIELVGMPPWSEEDQLLAKALQKEVGAEPSGLNQEVKELKRKTPSAGSDDIGEISWNVPTGNLKFPGNIPGAPMHHWASAVSMATPIGHKGATVGAKVQALTVLDFLLKPGLVRAAREYFEEQSKETKWVSLVPDGTAPSIDLNQDVMDRYRPALAKVRYQPEKYNTYLEQLGIRYPTVRQ